MNYINVPGIGNSGPTHWQSYWEAQEQAFKRFSAPDWDHPVLDDWIEALDREVRNVTAPTILVAHSIGCLLVVHWAKRSRNAIAGAFLVAVPDPAGPNFPQTAASFGHVSETPLRFPVVMIASRNDPYGPFDYVVTRASQWRAPIIDIGSKGHINGASELGAWPRGRQLLTAFAAGTRNQCDTV